MADPMNPPAPLYDLTTDEGRSNVRIDGELYELRCSRDLTLVEFQKAGRDGIRIFALRAKDELTDDEGKQLEGLLDHWCRRVLLAPPEVQNRLSVIHRLHIWDSFTELLTPRLSASGATTNTGEASQASPSRGEKSSQNSPGTTVSARARGRKKSRSVRSART